MSCSHCDFGVRLRKITQPFNMSAKNQMVQPHGSDFKIRIRRNGIRTMEMPAITILDGNSAVPAGMPEERDQEHAGGKRESNGIEIEPFFRWMII